MGTAVTAASHVPFNAKAAKRVEGAMHGLQLIRNADKVANIANDVIGDITTTVSGALGISIVVQIVRAGLQFDQFWLNVLITALISVSIVTGKAAGKKLALSRPEEVIFIVGKLLAKLEAYTGYSPFKKRRGKSKKGGEAVSNLLKQIHSLRDIRSMSLASLGELAREIRHELIKTVANNGGHLAPNLGVVELTLALHRVFNSPVDKIIWDVGHQCYVHKLLTGRKDEFGTLRQFGGICGFPAV